MTALQFSVVIPAYNADTTLRSTVASVLAQSDQDFEILIVDDDVLVARAIKRMLRRHRVQIVDDPRQALARLRAGERPDAILCDLMMPTMSGASFRDRLLEIDPGLEQRLVVVTGGAFSEEAQAFLSQSHLPVVEKPVDPTILNETVQAILAL